MKIYVEVVKWIDKNNQNKNQSKTHFEGLYIKEEASGFQGSIKKMKLLQKLVYIFLVQIFWGAEISFGIWHSKDNILILAQAKKNHTKEQIQDTKPSHGW